MTNTVWTVFVITAWLPQTLHGTTTKRADGTIQITKNNHGVVHFRIPEYFDLKGEKLNSLMEMLKERANMLHENELKRSEMHRRCLWIFGVIFPGYALASIIWVITNIIFYRRQKRKLKSSGEENTATRNQERERLLERYNQIPPAEPPFISHSPSPGAQSSGADSTNSISDHSTFEANRARVEAILKRNNEPQFMRRI